MKIAYFHCFSGASGDMILGALLDAGLPWEQLREGLALLPLKDFHLERERVTRKGIMGTRVTVVISGSDKNRRLADIKDLLDKTPLPESVLETSLRVFTRLAEAEGRVHGVTPGEITFHEAGATDAIIDVVGAVFGFWRLGIGEVYASPINVGGGFARSGHGIIPSPGPAVMELLQEIPVYSKGMEKELLTPTGAAILASCCLSFGDMPLMRVTGSGYGAGSHDTAIPNLLRLTIGEKLSKEQSLSSAGAADGCLQEAALMMEANIDDMNPEFYDYLISELLAAGAMDVFLQTIQMKKNRPAATLCVLMRTEDEEKFRRRIFSETTTLGLRVYPVTKYMLPCEIIVLSTALGQARVKIARLDGKICNIAPEYEDCRRLARENNLPLKEVYDIVNKDSALLIKR